jgi:hypothetical protein
VGCGSEGGSNLIGVLRGLIWGINQRVAMMHESHRFVMGSTNVSTKRMGKVVNFVQVKDPDAIKVVDSLDPKTIRFVRVDFVRLNCWSVQNSMEWKHSNEEGFDRNKGRGLEVRQVVGPRSDVVDAT